MKAFWGALIIMLGWTSASVAAVASQPRRNTGCTFEQSLVWHQQSQVGLYQTRGSRPAFLAAANNEPIPKIEDVTRWLAERVAEGAYPEGSHVLFFARKGHLLCSFLIDSSGLKAVGSLPALPSRLNEVLWNTMGAMQVSERQIARRARRVRTRGEPPAQPIAAQEPSAGKPAPTYQEQLAELADLLIRPAVARQLDPVRHLIVVPTENIGTIPFPALRPAGSEKYLVERFSISVAPGLRSLSRPQKRWDPAVAFRTPLIAGNPRLPKDEAWEVPSLPGAEAEAREVARTLKAQPLLGAAATKIRVGGAAAASSLLWIATHGIADDLEGVDGGFLMLSAPKLEQGFWTAREIQSNKLQAHLAVLSACQTGLGQAHEGGMIGLARAFQLAGVPRVLMSLWNVDDTATRELMTRFVQHARRHPPAEALRLAMLEVRQTHPHPTLWASFLLFGEAS